MGKKIIYLTVPIFLAVSFSLSSISAQDTTEGYKAKLKSLRKEKAQLTIDYEEAVHEVNKAAEDKMAKIKTEFRVAREECLHEKETKTTQLFKDYQMKLKPMLKEEEGLIDLLGSGATMDFVKTKAERERSK